MKYLISILLVLLLAAGTALAGDPLDTNDGPRYTVGDPIGGDKATVSGDPIGGERQVQGDPTSGGRYSGDPIDGNDSPRMVIVVYTPGGGLQLIDLFWWLRK